MADVCVEQVTKAFKGRTGQPFVALKNVDLNVKDGEFVSIIGHSGCGKSTLLNLVAGLHVATGGAIKVGGKVVKGPGPDRMVAFQNHSLLPWLSLRENITLAVEQVHRKLSKGEQRAMVDEHLRMVNLTPAADRLPSQVSGGMKQRCGIARALCTRPDVLLLDEPFGALDALTRANLQDQLIKIWEAQRITVLMITHDVEEALLLSDRVVMMSNGPEAKVAEIMTVELARPRKRLEIIDDPNYYRQRGELLYFLQKCKRAKAVKPPKPVRRSPSGASVEQQELTVGFVPLLDCAPFAVAEREGLFEKAGLHVTLSREPSWKAISDGLREGRLDAAQMVAGMPLAETLGLSGKDKFPTSTAITLSRGGNAITFGRGLVDAGVRDRKTLKEYVDQRKQDGERPLTLGMVHPASMHNLLLRDWLSAGGINPDRDVKLVVVPPPQMVSNLQRNTIAGYCVGEPWNVRAVRKSLGVIAATDQDIWRTHPEKVLGVSSAWADDKPKTHLALVRALLEACTRCDDAEYRRDVLPEVLSDKRFVGGAPEDIASCLGGEYDRGDGVIESSEGFVQFASGAGNVCHKDESVWILAQMVRWGMLPFPETSDELLARTYRREVLGAAADQAELSLPEPSSQRLELVGSVPFDAAAPQEYLDRVAGGVAMSAQPAAQ